MEPEILLASSRRDDLNMVCDAAGRAKDGVVTAGTFEEIQAFLASRPVALMIIDRDFGADGGLETASRLRSLEAGRDVPLMMIADKERADEAGAGYAMGAQDFLMRPVDPVMMKNKIAFFTECFRLKARSRYKEEDRAGTYADIRMNRVVGDLAGGIAHQFNNTLNIITGHVELLKMDLPDNGHVRRFSAMVFESVKKMTALTDKLLAYARAGNNKSGQVDLNAVLSECLTASGQAGDAITVTPDFDPGHILVDADESKLRMVFTALFKNAVEAIRDKGLISVKTRYVKGGDRRGSKSGSVSANVVCLEVKDNGIGMSREVTERIFEPFFSTKFQGRGLDMAAVQGIVTSHGGWIDVQSSPGEGTTVHVFLPVASYRPASEFRAPESFIEEPATVLVIDDDDCIRDLTLTMLKRLGYQAIGASAGREAIGIVERLRDKLDLAIIDIEMPDMKGDELYPRLIAICPDLKAIVCSGYSLEGRGEVMMAHGAQLFMQKPFSFGDLAMNMRKLIERRKEKRYRVRDGHALLAPHQEQIKAVLVDISRKGAAIQSGGVTVPDMGGWSILDILSEGTGLMVSGIPFQFLSRGSRSGMFQADRLPGDLMRVRFGVLPGDKLSQVDHFISRCAFFP